MPRPPPAQGTTLARGRAISTTGSREFTNEGLPTGRADPHPSPQASQRHPDSSTQRPPAGYAERLADWRGGSSLRCDPEQAHHEQPHDHQAGHTRPQHDDCSCPAPGSCFHPLAPPRGEGRSEERGEDRQAPAASITSVRSSIRGIAIIPPAHRFGRGGALTPTPSSQYLSRDRHHHGEPHHPEQTPVDRLSQPYLEVRDRGSPRPHRTAAALHCQEGGSPRALARRGADPRARPTRCWCASRPRRSIRPISGCCSAAPT